MMFLILFVINPTHKYKHACELIFKKLPESAGLPRLPVLNTPTDPGNTYEIIVSENSVIVGQERRALPLRQGVRQERVGPVKPAVKAETDRCGAGIISVLNEFLEHRGPLRIVQQHLPYSTGQVNLLSEIFQKDRLRSSRRSHPVNPIRRIKGVYITGGV